MVVGLVISWPAEQDQRDRTGWRRGIREVTSSKERAGLQVSAGEETEST